MMCFSSPNPAKAFFVLIICFGLEWLYCMCTLWGKKKKKEISHSCLQANKCSTVFGVFFCLFVCFVFSNLNCNSARLWQTLSLRKNLGVWKKKSSYLVKWLSGGMASWSLVHSFFFNPISLVFSIFCLYATAFP